MKITKTMRILLVFLAAIMAFSMFSCANEPDDETTAPQGNETTESAGQETTAPKADETTAPKGDATTAPAGDATTEPKETEPKDTEPKDTEPSDTEPKETEPKETEPKETEPKETEPKETEPKETEPKETEPKETEPKETEPKETEPKETEPKETEPPHEHTWVEATCKAPRTCSVCQATEGEALPHTEEVIPAVDATCKETGLTEGKKCSVCGDVIVAQTATEKLPHNEVDVPAVDATCKETGLTAGKKCSVCDEVIVAQTATEKLPHNEVYTSNGADGHTVSCSVCLETINTEAHDLAIDEDPCYKVCSKCDYKSETHEPIEADWTPVVVKEGGVDNPEEQKVCPTCNVPVEKRAAAFYLCPDNIKIDGTSAAHIANNTSGAGQTSGHGFGSTKQPSTPFELDAPEVFKDGKFVTSFVGLGGWVAINGGAKEYVYRVNGGEWQKAVCYLDNLVDGKPHINYIEKSNLGLKNYYANVLLDPGIFTNDLQAEYGGQTVNIEFGAVPENNAGAENAPNVIIIAKYNNIKVFKVTSVELGEFEVSANTEGTLYKYVAKSTGIYNLELPVISGVKYNVTLKNARSGDNVTKTNAGGSVIGIDVKSGDIVTVEVYGADNINGTVISTCFAGAYGKNFTPAGSLGNLSASRDGDGNIVLTAATIPEKNDKGEDQPIDRYFSFINNTKTAGRYVAVTYKVTNPTKLSVVHMQGYDEAGAEINWKTGYSYYYLNNDGEVHTAIFDIYENLPYGSTLRSFRFDVLEELREGGASITIIGFEVHDDASILSRKFNTAAWEAKGGSLVAVDALNSSVAKGTVAGTGNCLTSTNQATQDKDVYIKFLENVTIPGRYIVLRVKAHTSASTLATIYISGINKETLKPTGFTGATGISGASLAGNVNEWVTVIIDTNSIFNGDYYLEGIRVDHCEWSTTVGDRTMSFERVAVYTDYDLAVASAGSDTIYLCGFGSEIPFSTLEGDSDGTTYRFNAKSNETFNITLPSEGSENYNVTLTNTTTGKSVSSADAVNGCISIIVANGDVIDVKVVATPIDSEYPAVDGVVQISKYYCAYGSNYTPVGLSALTETRDDEGNAIITKSKDATPYFEVVCNSKNQTYNGRYIAITYKTVGCTGATRTFSKFYKADGTYVGWTDSTGEVTNCSTHIPLTNDTEDWQTIIIDTYDRMLIKGTVEEGAKLYSLRLDFGGMSVGNSITIKGVEFHDDYEYLASKFDNVTYNGVN